MTARDIVWGRGHTKDGTGRSTKPTTCIRCHGPLPSTRWLFCGDECSRAELREHMAKVLAKRERTP